MHKKSLIIYMNKFTKGIAVNINKEINNKETKTARRIPRKLLISLLAVVIVIAISVGGFCIYASDYYRADTQTIAALSQGIDVRVTELDDGSLAYGNGNEDVGFVFYPGGKVEHTAYEPLAKMLASKGVFCVIVKMPFNLAVLDMNAADRIVARYSDVGAWYIGGHSLGGSMAASHAAANEGKYKGLVLLGAYSTSSLTEIELDVLCLHGSEDKVMNREKHDECKKNLPTSAICTDIEGGCHAYFGSYGAQDGDGEPTITLEKQLKITVNSIYELMLRGE